MQLCEFCHCHVPRSLQERAFPNFYRMQTSLQGYAAVGRLHLAHKSKQDEEVLRKSAVGASDMHEHPSSWWHRLMKSWTVTLNLIDPRLDGMKNIIGYSFFFFLDYFFPRTTRSSHFLCLFLSTFFLFFFLMLFPLNARHSANHCVQPERRQVRTQPCKRQAQHFFSPPSIPHPPSTHTENEHPGQSLSPLSSSHRCIYPPIQSSHQAWFLGTRARNRWPSDFKSSLSLTPSPLLTS